MECGILVQAFCSGKKTGFIEECERLDKSQLMSARVMYLFLIHIHSDSRNAHQLLTMYT